MKTGKSKVSRFTLWFILLVCASSATAAWSEEQEQKTLHCECSVVSPNDSVCRDMDEVLEGEIVDWNIQVFVPPTTMDWDQYCFHKHSQHEAAKLACCDKLKSQEKVYYRGTLQD